MRRFEAGQRVSFAGLDFAISHGVKGPDDLVLKWRVDGLWFPVPMAAVQFMVEFFAENEQELSALRGHWRFNGDTYFLRSLHAAVRYGWRSEAAKTALQRAQRS